jgi:hypothetical protein
VLAALSQFFASHDAFFTKLFALPPQRFFPPRRLFFNAAHHQLGGFTLYESVETLRGRKVMRRFFQSKKEF